STVLATSLILTVCATALCSGVSPGAGGAAEAHGAAAFVPGEALVKFREGVPEEALEVLKTLVGTTGVESLPIPGLEKIVFEGLPLESALEVLRSSALVAYAEPNFIRSADFEPDDTDYDMQWNLNDPVKDADINMPAAWDIEQGDNGVVIAVLDTGVAYRTGGGYMQASDLAETKFVQGYDFINSDKYADDDNGHGTHVCGTVAQSTNNGIGVAGVAFDCGVMPVKVLDNEGKGSDSQIIEGIIYATNQDVDVINMSLSGPDPSEALEEAVDYAFSKGVVVCASSGNEDDDTVGYPAASASCVAVGATNKDKKRASYSNYGSALGVVAPGGDGILYSGGIIQQTFQTFGKPDGNFAFQSMRGTSMACPHVAGVAALVKSHRPAWSASEVRAAVTSTCRDLGSTGWDPEYGWGLIDADAALQVAKPALKVPVISGVSPGYSKKGTSLNVTVTGSKFVEPVKVLLERESENGIAGTSVTVSGSTDADLTVDLSGAQPGLWDVMVESSQLMSGVFEGGFMVDPDNNHNWYLAEGSTAYGFEEFVLIQNPGDVQANCEITFMTPGGALAPYPVAAPPDSRVTVTVNDVAPDTDVSAMIEADQDVICERSMYWGGRLEGTDCIGVQSPSYAWYLAEGTTDYGFETFLLIQNPSSRTAVVNVTYMTPGGPVEKSPFSIPANSRYSINVSDDLPGEEMSFEVVANRRVIAERSMYWDGKRGGHDSIGTNSPAREWYLGEGSTDWGYDEYILLENPGDAAANVDITYMTPEGPDPQPAVSVPAGSRVTVHVNDELPDRDVSAKVTADRGIVVERAMYWNNGTGKGGHCAIATPQPRQECFLAEGSTDWGFDEWILVQNPNDTEANVGVEYMTSAGLMNRDGFTLGAGSRVSIHVNSDIPPIDTSAYVFSNLPIIAERSMYWNSRGAGHASQGLMR
ncbi:MAG: S8 family serine peptidase, partial [Actinobacteria bacterium]|nr:S8 family serine peptidase [Actinomycetota bacterium]